MRNLILFVLAGLLFVTGCGVSGSAEGTVGGKTSGSANVANPVK